MELRHLRHFSALARVGHFSQAASSLNLAQPSLSRSIQKLESLLGVSLLDRRTKSVRLTAFGELVLRHGEQILASAEVMKHQVDELKSTAAGGMSRTEPGLQRLIAGAPPSAADRLTSAISRCITLMPELEVELRIAPLHVLQSAMQRGELSLLLSDTALDDTAADGSTQSDSALYHSDLSETARYHSSLSETARYHTAHFGTACSALWQKQPLAIADTAGNQPHAPSYVYCRAGHPLAEAATTASGMSETPELSKAREMGNVRQMGNVREQSASSFERGSKPPRTEVSLNELRSYALALPRQLPTTQAFEAVIKHRRAEFAGIIRYEHFSDIQRLLLTSDMLALSSDDCEWENDGDRKGGNDGQRDGLIRLQLKDDAARQSQWQLWYPTALFSTAPGNTDLGNTALNRAELGNTASNSILTMLIKLLEQRG
ncbi:LysR family transcriptional regulator [Shewanella sp. JM162201]|uniref:LysR family transcriptional regulator n=1 Tax=Shewanella jiangmenensis TaxID=2837387 RepID=A0ABS5V4W9_9GAMM|nr:LysR family transcriptional regulator [Shewanella jiangmenensis]MBT1444851.1 LysR family transcriptional regulator [Shewanella jiangmenensis]